MGKEECPPLHLDVAAIEKGAFWSSSTTVANFTLLIEISASILVKEYFMKSEYSAIKEKYFASYLLLVYLLLNFKNHSNNLNNLI